MFFVIPTHHDPIKLEHRELDLDLSSDYSMTSLPGVLFTIALEFIEPDSDLSSSGIRFPTTMSSSMGWEAAER